MTRSEKRVWTDMSTITITHQRIDIFCCYAPQDRLFLIQLRAHLALLERLERIRFWADTDIEAGMDWEQEILAHLETAQIILLLVSSDFIKSDYCYSTEMQRAMERHQRKEARVIPILVRPCLWADAPFGKLRALPGNGRPITDWPSQENALRAIAESIARIIPSLSKVQDARTHQYPPAHSPSPPPLAPQRRMHHWSENEWFKLRLLTLLLLADLLALMLLPAYPRSPTALSISDLHLQGWLFMRISLPGGPGVLATLELQTGATSPLTARSEALQHALVRLGLTNYNDPSYAPKTHQLAFIASDKNGKRGIWSVSLILRDGRPVMNSVPGALIDPCETTCENSLTWSPDGRWLLFTGLKGIEAIDVSTHTKKYLTSQNDRWPACSPDGKWLAYQGAQNIVQALATSNCMPLSQADASVRFLNSFSLSWFPAWSPDGKFLAFKSDSKPGWVLYKTSLADMPASNAFPPTLPIPIGEADCSTTTWARFQSSGHEALIFVCYDQAHPDGTYHLLIEPDGSPPAWQTSISAGTYAWSALDWTPSLV